MVNNDEFIPEEVNEQNQRLLVALRHTYDTRAEDAQSLSRIGERLLRNSDTGPFIVPRTRDPQGIAPTQEPQGRPQGPSLPPVHRPRPYYTTASRRLGTFAAALFVALLVGSLVILFNLAHHNRGAINLAPTGTPGNTMTPITSPNQAITSIRMLDATTGWARTDHAILHTTDGGTSWKDVTPPQHPLVPGSGTFFLHASTAWVAIPPADTSTAVLIFRTTDGGSTWQSTSIQPNTVGAEEITFIDPQHGWLLSHRRDAGGAETVDIFRTIDGGQTWTEVSSALASSTDVPPPGHLPFGGAKSGIGFLNATTGWVTGTSPLASYPLLYVSHDGGSSWQQQMLPIPRSVVSAQLSITPPTFFTAQDGILPAKFDTGAINLEPSPGERYPTFLDVYVTHDGGKTWQFGSLLPALVSTADFIDVNHGWATNGTILYTTSNGGQSWTKVSTSQNFKNITSLNFVSSEVGWAVSRTGSNSPVLLKTVNGGRNWIQVA